MRPTTPYISFAVTCMNRLYQLRETLPYNLRTLSTAGADLEIVLVNYGSTDGLDEWMGKQPEIMSAIADGRLVYVKVEANSWHMSKAKNLAHRFANGEYIFNLDGDNFITRENVDLFRRQWELDDAGIICQVSLNPCDGTCGRIGLRQIDFMALGGYDELLPPVAGQDTDLLERAKIRGHNIYRHLGGIAIANSIERKMAFVALGQPTYWEMLKFSTKVTNERREKRIWRVNEQGWGEARNIIVNLGATIKTPRHLDPLFPPQGADFSQNQSPEATEFNKQLALKLCEHHWIYRRIGYDEREMNFAMDGTIGIGAAHCERKWKFSLHADWACTQGAIEIIGGDGKTTCQLQYEAATRWTGKWVEHERMPVELIPVNVITPTEVFPALG